MSMLGKVENLVPLIHPGSRLRRGLELLRDCVHGRCPDIMQQVANLAPGETSQLSNEGEDLYVLMQCYHPRAREDGRFEAHERYTDLQFLLSGREHIEVCSVRSQQIPPRYNSQGNFYFPMGNHMHSLLLLSAGEVAVLAPEDAHAPCLACADNGAELVRKIVVKIRDAHLPDSGANKDATDAATAGPALAGLNQ